MFPCVSAVSGWDPPPPTHFLIDLQRTIAMLQRFFVATKSLEKVAHIAICGSNRMDVRFGVVVPTTRQWRLRARQCAHHFSPVASHHCFPLSQEHQTWQHPNASCTHPTTHTDTTANRDLSKLLRSRGGSTAAPPSRVVNAAW